MAKIFSSCRICVIIPRTASTKKWTKDQIEKWVKMAGGVLHKEFDPQTTTHLVVEEQLWKNRTMAVQLALEANDNGRKVYIVTPQWFDDCLVTQKKLREKEFLWENIDQKAAGDQRKKRGKVSELVREKVRQVLEDETGLAEKRARMCDENEFLKLLWAFNQKGIHFN